MEKNHEGKLVIAKKINESQDMFKLHSLEVQYPGIKGGVKWAVATDLTREELEASDGCELQSFKPYIIITPEQGEVFEEFERMQKKLRMQDFRHTDMNAYEDGMEISLRATDYIHGLSREVDSDEALNAYLIRVAIKQLPELLQRRLRMFFFHGLSEQEIADIEGVSQPAVHYSIKSGIRQLRYMLDI
ncbi:sigma-70 family RNA polymerase sigma factor [Butyrivibrio sp. XB500-5]|uniref:sigma-70 family RNA polymerase sigma factor n=1 Tax=Butyrivibrio sp. XB500-5 TaxID=2364880 RepID=UPI000EA98DF0|nr:sigma-70 family RNA polymerase sigma factor [Butyrivibrio sp. XB500-5]RKM63002.1 sigma-70 family RNA polymerase sigma factor [Butyrivibrio sp. XB500-5]